ncbi:hypothetical protein JCM1840_004467 [Sporobolomyces johnsonii]
MIDSLIQFLLEEIAMDADEGTSLVELAKFVAHFYSTHAPSSSSSSNDPSSSSSASTIQQTVDDAFLGFIWDTLVDQPDVRVGLLTALPAPPLSPEPAHAEPNAEDDDDDEEDIKPRKKKKKAPLKPKGPTHEMRILGEDEGREGRDALVQRYGEEGLRVVAGAETAWAAITGSHARPTAITPMVYQILRMISRGRGEGATAVRISKELGVDPKSVFHYCKFPQQLGIIKKFGTIDQGSRTNRLLHVRYLSTSPHWAIHIASEPSAADADSGDEGAGEEDDEDRRPRAEPGQMSTISALYLSTNIPLVKARVVKALKGRKDWWMAHSEIAATIGLHSYSSQNLRRLNAIITTMAADGIVEKIAVSKKKAHGNITTVQALRLLKPDGVAVKSEAIGDALPAQQQDDDDVDGVSYPLVTRSMERQILDLLMEADTRGLTGLEISDALGHYAVRTVDVTLQRLGRTPLPSFLGDYAVHSLTETVGRLKRTRWFSLVGYLKLRREKGAPDEKMEAVWRGIEEAFGREDAAAGEQYREVGEMTRRLKKVKTMEGAGAPLAKPKKAPAAGAKPKAPPKEKATGAQGKGKGKAKADDQDAPAADDQDDQADTRAAAEPDLSPESASESEPTPRPPRARGRPRKHPIVEGKESWYQRKKRLDAERIAQGLPPEESYYQRKKREEKEDREREAMGLPKLDRSAQKKTPKQKVKSTVKEEDQDRVEGAQQEVEEIDELEEQPDQPVQPVAGPSNESAKKKRGRPRKNPVVEAVAAQSDAASSSEPTSTPATPTAQPKKRGRPSKAAKEAEAAPPAEEERASSKWAPPRKRTRLSLAKQTPTESAPVTPAPHAHAKKHERASRLSGAPIPVPADEPMPDPAAAASTLTTPAPAARSRLQSPNRRIEAFVEIEAPSSPKKRRLGPSNSAPSPSAEPSATPAEPSAFTGDAVAGPSSPAVLTSDAIAGLSSPSHAAGAELELPTPPVRFFKHESTPSSSAVKKPKRPSARASITSKDNLTALTRQQEVLDYAKAQGGIFENVVRANEAVRDFAREQKPSAPAYLMDRNVFKQILDTMVKRESLRKTVAMGTKGERREIFYLPTIALDSPEMVDFLDTIVNKGKTGPVGKWGGFDKPEGLVIDEDVDNEDHVPGTQIGSAVDEPSATDDADTVREFFRRQNSVVGASHGVRHGLFARARQLHKWLASFVFKGQSSFYLAVVDDIGFVLTHAAFVSAMPLGVFVRIVPIPVESDELDAFLADSDNLSLSLVDVPDSILKIIQPSANKRKKALWNVLQTLIHLHLLTPLVPTGTTDGSSAFEVPTRPKLATHWRFASQAPIYALSQEGTPLVATAELDSNETVARFWDDLQFFAVDTSTETTPLENAAFPPRFDGTSMFRKQLQLRTKWRDGYYLLRFQRHFLTKVVQADPDLVTDAERSADVEKWARCLYAPVEVVRDYLHSTMVRLRRSAELDVTGGRRKKRKVARQARGDAEGDEDEEEDEEEDTRPPVDAQTALSRKVKEAAVQRERDWTTIVDKFRADHAQPNLNDEILNFLHRRFMDPRKQIDARQLHFELRQLLPERITVEGDAGLKTVVSSTMRRRAKQAQDPYAVSRLPNIRRRVRAQKPKVVKKVYPRKSSPLPVHHGDQNDFLSTPAQPRPAVEPGKRVSRTFYTSEQDDLLLDAVAILKARSKTTGLRIAYGALEHLFKGHKGSVLRNRSITLVKKPEDQAYHDRLVQAWLEIYKLKKNDPELADPNKHSMVDFDLASFIRCLRQNVDKRVLRLTRTVAQTQPEAVRLPETLEKFNTAYTVKPGDGALKPSAKWETYWTRTQVASTERDKDVMATSFATSWPTPKDDKTETDEQRREALTVAALKTVLSTPEDKYTENQGDALLKRFSTKIDDVVQDLTNKHVIVSMSSEIERRIPGRNFSYDDKFLDRFDNRITLERLPDAANFEKELHKDSFDGIFPVIPTEGEMMALIDLVSEGKIDLTIDTSMLSDKTLRYDDFGTRQANDDDIECTINLEPTSTLAPAPRAVPLPQPLLPETATDDAAALDVAKQAVAAQSTTTLTLAVDIADLLDAAGASGLSMDEIAAHLPHASRSALLTALSTLSTSEPPLAFPAGLATLAYVSARHLSSWTLPLSIPSSSSSSSSEKTENRLAFPAAWTDVNGQVNEGMWVRAMAWVKGELLHKSGMTLSELYARSCARHCPLTLTEVRLVLETLERAGVVSRKRGDELFDDGDEENAVSGGRAVDWDTDRWRLAGVFW